MAAILCALPTLGMASAVPFSELIAHTDKIRSSDPRQFQKLLSELDIRRQEASPQQKELIDLLHAYSWAYSGKYETAINEAKSLFDRASDISIKFRAGLLVANSCAINKNYTEGLRALSRALPLREKVPDPELRQDGLTVAAVLYNQLGQYELGRLYAEQMLAGTPSMRGRCFAGEIRLEALYNLKQLPADDEQIKQVIDQCSRQGELIATNLARNYLARKWADDGRVLSAIALLDQHAEEVKSTHYPSLIGDTNALLAEYRLAVDDLQGAEGHARIAIENSRFDYSLPLTKAYKILYDVDLRKHDTEAALNHFRLYAEADKAYLDVVKARELAFQLASHETAQKTQQIELLNKKNQVLQLQQRVDRQATQNTQLIAALLAVLLATIGYWAYKTKRMQMSFRHLAETDALTGISNRHHFTHQAEEALTYCKRTGQDVGLIMFDLDQFKSINDRFGHVIGDHVLKLVAQECKSRCRKNDRFGRIGGEEFAILLIGCDLETTVRMAQACCKLISQIDTSQSGHCFPVTASFGVTSASQSGYDLTRMMSHADEALYQSKDEGRDQVQVFVPDAARDRAPTPQIA